jgi:RHS repeat-associated protein
VYDHRSRLLESYHKIGNGTEVLLSRNNYNELGQVIEKNTGLSNFAIGYLQSTDYAYNIRGWLSKINSSTLNENENDLFGMELYYQSSTIPGSTNVYNGNISGMVWKNKPSNTTKSYRFGYDNLNRLINANYAEGTNFASNTGYYDETYQYDANGNITLLVRKSNNLEIDRLTYNYYDLGNRLKEIIDGAPAGSKTNGLNDRNTSSSIDYEYDKNGNLLKDYNKQMAINSNYLNLPSKISCTTASITDKIEYLYDAQGNKLAKKVNGAAEEEHYMGDVLIKRTGNTYTVSYLLHSEGVVSNTSSALVYEYFLKDHLGNVRVKYTADANSGTLVQQATDYYPFGLTMTPIVLNNDNKFLYNGKELQENTINNVKLDWYDYGFRMYDPQLGRWHCVDPLAELDFSFSPYNFCLNNPIKLIDPNGLSTHTDSTGAVIAVYDDDDNSVYKHRTLPKSYAQDDAGVEYKEEKDKDGNIKKVPVNKLTGGENMGETEFWNEFISPESGNVMTETTIQFGKSWDPIIDNMAAIADDMDLTQIAANSGGGGLFDIKAKYSNVGGLLNGKYATSRSAGNYLAGYNAQGGSYFGIGISFTIFQKMAGALHEKGTLTDKEKAGIYLKGTSYGPPPAYGEEIYQYRMSKLGWDASKNK